MPNTSTRTQPGPTLPKPTTEPMGKTSTKDGVILQSLLMEGMRAMPGTTKSATITGPQGPLLEA